MVLAGPGPMTQSLRIGLHEIYVESPIFWVKQIGAASLAEYDAINSAYAHLAAVGRVDYMAFDVREAKAPSPELRQRMAVSKEVHNLRLMVLYGAPPALVVLARLLRRGMELLGKTSLVPFHMVKNEAEVRALVANDVKARAR